MSEMISELPNTYQSPTMAPFCEDNEKYQVVEEIIKQIEKLKANNVQIDGQEIGIHPRINKTFRRKIRKI